MPEIELKGNQTVTRVITSRKTFSATNPPGEQIKPNAFMPPSEMEDLSVLDITDKQDAEIWALCGHVKPDSTIYGRGDLSVSAIREIDNENGQKLRVWKDGNPVPEHCNIRPIPAAKDKAKLVALQLRRMAVFEKADYPANFVSSSLV